MWYVARSFQAVTSGQSLCCWWWCFGDCALLLEILSFSQTDPSHVIGLYPNLLPQDFRSKLEYPERVPDLEGHEIESGLLALIEYLTQKRNELMKKDEVVTTAIVEGNTTIKSKKQLSQIIDTTLLKCYLQVGRV